MNAAPRDNVITERPDLWVILEFRDGDNITYKVLASFFAGYLGDESWMLNSGIERVVDLGDRYHFYGFSGSGYACYKGNSRYAMSRPARAAYESMMNKLTGSAYSMRLLEEAEVEATLRPLFEASPDA